MPPRRSLISQLTIMSSFESYGFSENRSETSDPVIVHFDRYTITLHAVPSGNVRPRVLSASEFHNLAGSLKPPLVK
jgi:hypothetical protein